VFKNIDLSWGNGWTKYICVSIDSSQTARIFIDELNKRPIYLIGNVKDTSLSKLNYIINSTLKQTYPSLIGPSVVDAGVSHIIIDNHIHSTVMEHAEPNKLDTIINILINLNNYKLKSNADTTFVYKSLSKIKPPPPQMETTKFVPPVVKDDVIEK